MENNQESYGTLETPSGIFKIMNFVQTEFVHGRQLTVLQIENDTLYIKIESTPEGSFEKTEQQMWLTHKSVALLMTALCAAEREFKLNFHDILVPILNEGKVDVRFGKPDATEDPEEILP